MVSFSVTLLYIYSICLCEQFYVEKNTLIFFMNLKKESVKVWRGSKYEGSYTNYLSGAIKDTRTC